MSEKKKQKTLGAFGFSKKRLHRGKLVSVEIPTYAQETTTLLKCDLCPKRFKNNQGLSVHMKCIHEVVGSSSTENDLSFKSKSVSKQTVNVEREVGYVLNSLIDKVN